MKRGHVLVLRFERDSIQSRVLYGNFPVKEPAFGGCSQQSTFGGIALNCPAILFFHDQAVVAQQAATETFS
ncbi:MAG: hypothetical protein A4E66_02520 [Syntrophus sp. PtaB.Bin001]|nr:MAG: hypothetical protein A4E66_02520 [Syntrophus sp. PtaB.Bin001]